MHFEAIQSIRKVFAARINFLLLVCVGLLISNLFLVWLAGWAFTHQKRTLIPITMNYPFTVSDHSVDASYLQQMALTFVPLRLNITPENVKKAHALLLQYVDSRFYHEFYGVLNQETKAIIKQKISSYFDVNDITVDVSHLRVLVTGILNRSVGSLSLAPVQKKYLLTFHYQAGILSIHSFSEVGKKEGTQNGERL